MHKRFIIAAVLFSAVLVTGCASVPMASDAADRAAKTFKTDPTKANIYVYRNETFGSAVRMMVTINGEQVGETASETFIFRQVDPGRYTIATSSVTRNYELAITVQAGKNYFVWQEVKMGYVAAESELKLVNEARGKKGVLECDLVKALWED